MTFKEIIDTIEAEPVVETVHLSDQFDLVCCTDLLSEVLFFARKGSILITSLARPYTIRAAHVADIRVVVFAYTKEIDREIITLAESKGITLLVTQVSTSAACKRLYRKGLVQCF